MTSRAQMEKMEEAYHILQGRLIEAEQLGRDFGILQGGREDDATDKHEL